ncbi:MAG: tRNA (adenosine(37)-N6)-threonylcarbamoyltransferase complex ATPase subunit type 1 TsaE [Saprospiraceae bacterium]
MENTIQTLTELPQLAVSLLHFAGAKKVILFTGEIGAGKTTLIKALGKQLGIQQLVTSPTFSIINEYSYLDADGKETPLYHMDLYRLKNLDEAIDIGIEDYLYSGNYCFIEWPAVIENLLPPEVVQVQIEITADSSRKFIFL